MGKRKRVKRTPAQKTKHLKGTPHELPSTNHEPLAFGLSHMDAAYCIVNCDDPTVAKFVKILYELSQRTWAQLYTTDRNIFRCHKVPVEQINIPALRQAVTADVHEYTVFYLSEKARIGGYRYKSIYEIVWVDLNHKVYDG